MGHKPLKGLSVIVLLFSVANIYCEILYHDGPEFSDLPIVIKSNQTISSYLNKNGDFAIANYELRERNDGFFLFPVAKDYAHLIMPGRVLLMDEDFINGPHLSPSPIPQNNWNFTLHIHDWESIQITGDTESVKMKIKEALSKSSVSCGKYRSQVLYFNHGFCSPAQMKLIGSGFDLSELIEGTDFDAAQKGQKIFNVIAFRNNPYSLEPAKVSDLSEYANASKNLTKKVPVWVDLIEYGRQFLLSLETDVATNSTTCKVYGKRSKEEDILIKRAKNCDEVKRLLTNIIVNCNGPMYPTHFHPILSQNYPAEGSFYLLLRYGIPKIFEPKFFTLVNKGSRDMRWVFTYNEFDVDKDRYKITTKAFLKKEYEISGPGTMTVRFDGNTRAIKVYAEEKQQSSWSKLSDFKLGEWEKKITIEDGFPSYNFKIDYEKFGEVAYFKP